MASNKTNRFQSLDSLVEEFIDGHENENTKKKTKHDVALSTNLLFSKARRDKWTKSFDSSRAEQVSQRVPYNGSQKRRQRGIRV